MEIHPHRRSEEYKALKQERSQVLYTAIEKFIPDLRSRIVAESQIEK